MTTKIVVEGEAKNLLDKSQINCTKNNGNGIKQAS